MSPCECRREDGHPKASFETYEAAMEAVLDPGKVAYQCGAGNWHHGTKVSRAMRRALKGGPAFVKPTRWKKKRR